MSSELVVTANNYAYVVDTTTWATVYSLQLTGALAVRRAAFSPNGDYLAVCYTVSGDVKCVQLYDRKNSYAPINPSNIHFNGGATWCAFNHAGTYLAVGGGGFFRVYSTSEWTEVTAVTSLALTNIMSFEFSPDDSMLAVAMSSSPFLRIILTSNWSYLTATLNVSSTIKRVRFSPDGTCLATVTQNDPVIRALSTTTWANPYAGYINVGGYAIDCAFSHSGDTIAVITNYGNKLVIADTSTWTAQADQGLGLTSTTLLSVNYSSDDLFIAVSDTNPTTLRVYNTGTWSAASATIPDTTNPAYSVQFDTVVTYANLFSIEDSFIVSDLTGYNQTFGFVDDMRLSDAAIGNPIFGVADRLLASDTITPHAAIRALLSDTLSLTEALPMIARVMIADGVTLADESPASLTKIAEFAEILSAADGHTPTIQIATLLMDLIAAREALSFVQSASLEDVITMADQTAAAIRLITESADYVSFVDGLRCGITALISDQVSAADLIHPQLHILMGYSDTLVVMDGLVLDDGETYTAWVMNAETTGMSRYTVPALNSLFDHDGRVWGVSAGGLWELAGDTDDGEPIDAWVKTGHFDFGTGHRKNLPRAYLYVKTTGEMALRVTSSDRGTRTERTYPIHTHPAGDDEAGRIVKLARGLKGVYWQVEIANTDGCDFEIEGCEVYPVALSRRGQ